MPTQATVSSCADSSTLSSNELKHLSFATYVTPNRRRRVLPVTRTKNPCAQNDDAPTASGRSRRGQRSSPVVLPVCIRPPYRDFAFFADFDLPELLKATAWR